MTLGTLIFRYALFAVMATVANLGTQRLVFLAGETGLHFVLAVLAGTGVGLALKYVLDKRWIFYDRTAGLVAQRDQFALYTIMGLVTTAIFWGTETVFWLVWQTATMRETGALIGLAVGYVVKYQLDRRFVFTDARLRRSVAT